jgi:lipopolysaccharide export system protein LptA
VFSVQCWAFVALLIYSIQNVGAQVQSAGVGSVSNFKTSEYYAQNPKQLKFELTCTEGRPLAGKNQILITQMKIQTYRVTGEREIIIDAPECLYDSDARTAGSAGHVRIQSGDGRFSVAGEGFVWQQSVGILTISNQVRAEIQQVLTNTAAANSPLVITSRWFTFDATNRYAVFHEEVHGDDPAIEFTCGRLAVHAAADGGSFEVIEAEESPVIIGKLEGRRVTADRAIYTRAEERAELFGNATWQQGRQSGRADRAVVRRLEKDLVAEGHVAMKLPRESLGAGGNLLSRSNAPVTAVADTNAPLVDLRADHFQSRSNIMVAEGAVQVVDATNRLTCDRLTVISATPTTPEETATAAGNVVVERGGGTLRAALAVYTKSDAAVVFTGDPRWTQAQMEGQAERVTVRSETGEVHGENAVAVKVQMGKQNASFLTFFPAAKTNSSPQEVEVFAREFTAKEQQVIFLGDVRTHQLPITGSEPRLRSDELEVNFAAADAQPESLQARKNVLYEQGTPGVTNGPAIYRKLSTRTLTAHAGPPNGALSDVVAEGEVQVEQPGSMARGERATYTAATDVLELTGTPTLDTPQARITEARTLVWDKAKNRFVATAPYRIMFIPDAKQALAVQKALAPKKIAP